MVNEGELKTLLANTYLQRIENEITRKMDCALYNDNLPVLIRIMKGEVDESVLPLSDIENFIIHHSQLIIDFGVLFLGKYRPESMVQGFTILYSIYLIYLKRNDEAGLLEFLKRRRIPKPQKFMVELLHIKQELNV